MARSNRIRPELVPGVLPATLVRRLETLRAMGRSWEAIAAALHVTPHTLLSWRRVYWPASLDPNDGHEIIDASRLRQLRRAYVRLGLDRPGPWKAQVRAWRQKKEQEAINHE